MNYDNLYKTLIEKRKVFVLENEYFENHHILPKSLGGLDCSDNLVRLTGREHFIAHLLLTKIYENELVSYKKMVKAFMMMLYIKGNRINSHKYEKLRKDHSKFIGEQNSNLIGNSNSQFGTKWIHNLELKQNKKIPKIKMFLMDG
jgi:hypothetical protein